MDPVAAMLAELKNAAKVKRSVVVVPASTLKEAIAKVLQAEGYLASYTKKGKKMRKFLTLNIGLKNGEPAFSDVKRLSKPSRRLYGKATELKTKWRGVGTIVVSTPEGVMTTRAAKATKVGGELLFAIW